MSDKRRLNHCIRVILLSLSAGACFGVSACQQNPDKDFVVNKNENIFESIVAEKNVESQELNAPESYQDSFVIDGGINVSVDAAVKSVQTDLPVVNVVPHMITEDEAKLWADVFFEGKTAYEPKVEMTRAEIESTILMYRTRIEEVKNSEDAQEREMADIYQQELSYYENIYESASENVEPVVCDFTFHSYDYFMTAADRQLWSGNDEYESLKNTQQIKAEVQDLNGHSATVIASRRNEADYILNTLNFFYLDSQNMGDIPYKEMTQDEAAAIADQTVKDLQLSDWVLDSGVDMSDATASRYLFNYTMTCQGLPVLTGYTIDLKSEDAYAANYYYSSLEITIRNGIVESVFLISPMDVVNTENENVRIKSFDEAYELFKSQMTTSYTMNSIIDFGSDTQMKNAKKEIRVDDIELGMFRVSKKDAAYEYMLIPVWSYSGHIFIDGEDWGVSNVCMLNAVDGSTIDVTLGY